MAYCYGKKKIFGEKIGRFFRKATLTAIFAGVAGAGGVGYHHYDIKEDAVAKVTSVEMKPPSARGEKSVMIVHADKGAFVNQSTWLPQRGKSDTQEFATKLRPGVTEKFTVYGANSKLGRSSPDDFSVHRNIANAGVEGAPVPVPFFFMQAPASAPAQVVIPPAPSMPEQETFAEARARMPASEVCAANGNAHDMAQKLPRLARDIEVLSQLPLTGRPVYDMLRDPASGIQSCIFPAYPKLESTSTYSHSMKTARIASNSSGLTSIHEYFHAMQGMNGGNDGFYRLTMRDAVIDTLLQEASAVAYEMAARHEAESRGLSFHRSPAVREERPDGSVIIWTRQKTSTDEANVAAFREAYDSSWKQNASADAETREAKALEAGGKAVVRRLLLGRHNRWNVTYTALATEKVSGNSHIFSRNNGTAPDYAARRDEAFRKMGAVSPKINFIPEEYLGPDAEYHIGKCFQVMGFRFEKPASPPVPPALS